MRDDFPVWGIPAAQQRGLLIVALIFAAVSLVYSLILTQRERDLYPLFVWIGSGLAVFLEPIGDIFSQVVYPIRTRSVRSPPGVGICPCG